MTRSTLAIEGGPPAVKAPLADAWPTVSALEKAYVNHVLEHFHEAYSQIEQFEEEFRHLVGTRHALCMCNGTATLHSAIFAAGARTGREVIVPSVTWHASISPILHCGATPVFCEVDPDTFCMDPRDAEARITGQTCAIVVTHAYGNPADMDGLIRLVEGTDIKLIEDASHAHGAEWAGRPVGAIGHIGCFSLQASKAVTGIEAGVAVTDDDDLYDRMLALGHYGRCAQRFTTDQFRDLHNIGLGVKYRANPLGVAMARAQLKRLPLLNERRSAWFDRLDALLEPVAGVTPQQIYPQARRGGLLLYTGRLDPEIIGAPVEMILKALVAEGVDTTPGITPFGYGTMHLEPLFTDFSFEGLGGPWGDLDPAARQPLKRGSLPISEAVHDTCFWLKTPVEPAPEWVEQIGAAFRKVASQGERLAELAGEMS